MGACAPWGQEVQGFCSTSFSRSLRKSFLIRIKAFLLQPTSVQGTSNSLCSLCVQDLCFVQTWYSDHCCSQGHHYCEFHLEEKFNSFHLSSPHNSLRAQHKGGPKRWHSILYSYLGTDLGHQRSTLCFQSPGSFLSNTMHFRGCSQKRCVLCRAVEGKSEEREFQNCRHARRMHKQHCQRHAEHLTLFQLLPPKANLQLLSAEKLRLKQSRRCPC